MNEASKKIDAKLDGWLANWPAPQRDDGVWDDFDEKLEARLTGLTVGHGEDAWMDPPLPAEPGEGEGDKLDAGGASMSEPESEQPKKKSLKDFAQRVSVAPPVSDAKPTATPLPKSGDTPLPSSGSRTSSPSLRGSGSFVARAPEARDSDSGIVDLNAVRKSAISVPDTGAQPGEAGLFDDEVKPAAPLPAKKASLMPIVGGGLVAVLAMAAAVVLLLRVPDKSMQSEESPVAAMAASAAAPLATQAPQPEPGGLTADGLRVASDETATGEPAPAAAPAKGAAEPESAEAKDKPAAAKSDKSEPEKPAEDPKTLAGAMATAVGAETKKADETTKPTAVADPGSLPETPSQGAIAGAIGSVRDAARACVAGMDEPSRATITFASNGSVSNVSVGGAAAGKPAAGCIQAALKRARVSPFKKDSFSVGVTVRP